MNESSRRPPAVLNYAAFTRDPAAGNPAGIVLDDGRLRDRDMLRIADEVGFSETAFLVRAGSDSYDVRYFSPRTEVTFCGHATIAAAVALVDLGEAVPGTELTFATAAGDVLVRTGNDADGWPDAELASVTPAVADVTDQILTDTLTALGWAADDLDPALPPKVAYAGAHHLVLAARSRHRLATLEYDVAQLRDLMEQLGWTTVHLVWRESTTVFHARDPFPTGGVVEDPATGAAAAAFGGYLRNLTLVTTPTTVTIHQGVDMGRPSRLTVRIPAEHATGVGVSGNAVRMS